MDPGSDHDCGRRAALDACPHEARVFEFSRGAHNVSLGVVELLDRERLPGEAPLAHEEVFGREHPYVARDHVARRQADDIARHQVPERHLPRGRHPE